MLGGIIATYTTYTTAYTTTRPYPPAPSTYITRIKTAGLIHFLYFDPCTMHVIEYKILLDGD